MKIAIIGCGIAGLSAARLLNQHHDITVYDKNNYIGGHSNTVCINSSTLAPVVVDTGFIVFNQVNYPYFSQMLKDLTVDYSKSDMSFGVSLQKGKTDFEYNSDWPMGVFANLLNIARPSYWSFLNEIVRFNKVAKIDLKSNLSNDESLEQYVRRRNFSEQFITHYLIPMAAAIWSSPFQCILNFPVSSFMHFMNNHGLLSINNRPQWYTVDGGSQNYVKQLIKPFEHNIKLQKVITVHRSDNQVEVIWLTSSGIKTNDLYDQVVIATHADEALSLLACPSTDEKNILGGFTYQENKTYLHQDSSFMPKRKRAWASWNSLLRENIEDKNSPVCVTYWMNKLQNLSTKKNFFVTLNPPYRPQHIHKEFVYHHPSYDAKFIVAQQKLSDIQGKNNTWFCGSYFGHGFHEDALVSGIKVAQSFGVPLNWTAQKVNNA